MSTDGNKTVFLSYASPDRDRVLGFYPLEKDWVESGTSDWESLNAFVFGEEGITFSFGAYSVAPYAWGPQSATVAYEKIVQLMRPEYRSALDLYYSD